MNGKDFLIISLVFVIMMAAVQIMNVVDHENAHKQIARQHGCQESVINYNFVGTSTHQCLNYTTNRPSEWVLQERMLHSQNEIVGYNVSTAVNGALGAVYLIIIAILLAGDRNGRHQRKDQE